MAAELLGPAGCRWGQRWMARFGRMLVLAKPPEVGRGRWTNHMFCPWSSGLGSGELGGPLELASPTLPPAPLIWEEGTRKSLGCSQGEEGASGRSVLP